MKIRIESDGTIGGTKVSDANGAPIEGISSLNIIINAQTTECACEMMFVNGFCAQTDVEAWIDERHLRELAESVGFKLVKA